MDTISQTTFSDYFVNETFRTLIKISFKFVLKGPIGNKAALL